MATCVVGLLGACATGARQQSVVADPPTEPDPAAPGDASAPLAIFDPAPSYSFRGSIAPGEAATPYACDALDFGIYWYDARGQSAKAYPDGRAMPGFYDPSRRTVLFIHGWMVDKVAEEVDQAAQVARGRASFRGSSQDVGNIDVQRAWVEDGWNVGIFHWTQLADEPGIFGGIPVPRVASHKIWSTDASELDGTAVAGRWRNCAGGFSTDNAPPVPIYQLLIRDFTTALQGFRGSELRLAGHSLGSQLAVLLAGYLHDAPATEVPTRFRTPRVALLDPFFGAGAVRTADDASATRISDRMARRLRELSQQGVRFEWLKTSGVNDLAEPFKQARPLDELAPTLGRRVGVPNFLPDGIGGVARRHQAASKLYFWEYAFGPSAASPSAATPTAELPDPTAGVVPEFRQVGGQVTPTPEDDIYRCESACETL